MSEAEAESPLIKALPPVSDYLTYLTIVEYNLTPENLPILHKVLQDQALTTNIGWDLVHLLVPYLPESEQCLQDIARLGNPREVILKVTESLRLIEFEQEEAPEEPTETLAGATDSRVRADSSTYPIRTAQTAEGEKRPGSSQMVELPPPLPLPVSQCIALLSMLSILHSRIKTKYPSRFLSTTMQAILGSFSNAGSHREELVLAIVKATRLMLGIQRPALPSRKSSGMMSAWPMATSESAADPEGVTAGAVDLSHEEKAMQTKLLQSFITHVIEEYMLNLPADEEVPGLAWCGRIMEKVQPRRIIPETQTVSERFQKEEKLHRRIDAVGQLVTLAQDLKLGDDELLSAAITVESVPTATHDEDEPPTSAEDIPLSRLGSLLLYTARQASSILYDNGKAASDQPFSIFPDHQEILKNCLSSPAQGTGTLGTEPETLVDAVLALGLICLERNAVGEPATDEQFNEYLQVTALLSSNCPSPNLRGHAHYLTSTILRSQPDDNARLTFIRDTLEHCPFENLKVSAVGWIKGETIEANPPTSHHGHDHGTHGEGSDTPSIFATPLALDSLAPFIFPSLHADLITAPLQDAWITFQTNVSFYLAALNFVYLLLSAKHLHRKLSIADLWQNTDVAGSFLQPLRDASARFREEMDGGGRLADERSDTLVAELSLLDETLARVTKAVKFLNE
ncbi:hypothetical protein LTR36_002007 [Oleoguttula mirabilis]|uniref:DUF1760-domain-containing protein n=1 Tax=Oleoguttula mirabilis TaxID=1507867 RepID=A0AAV9JLV6_9PEZI|nr:hypothetical protein LTR36_002007 [Oleoguttula mirabilis]